MKQKPRISKTPPPGWPTEEKWKQIEKELAKSLPSIVPSADAPPMEWFKFHICEQFVIYLRDQKISQRELAKRLGVTESRVSEIVHYHHGRFTIDKLIELLLRIKPKIKIRMA